MATDSGPGNFTFDRATGALLTTTGGGGGPSSVNIAQILGATVALSNPLPVELSDGTNPFGTALNPLSVNVISGGGSNASVGVTGAAAPASATEIGIIDGTGKLQGASVSNPVRVDPTGTTIQPVSGTITSVIAAVGVDGTTAPTSSIEIGSIDASGKLQGASASNPVPVTITGASSSGGNVKTQDGTPGTQFIFQEILMELRAMRKLLMLVYEESGQGSLAQDLMDDVNSPSSSDYS